MEELFTFRKETKTIEKTRTIWSVEPKDGEEASSEHSSRTKAILTFCRRHPNNDFRFTIPPTHDAQHPTTVILSRDGDKWAIKTAHSVVISKHGTLSNAIASLFGNFPFVEEFQISISGNKGGHIEKTPSI